MVLGFGTTKANGSCPTSRFIPLNEHDRYKLFLTKLLLLGIANKIDDLLLDMVGSVIVWRFNTTYFHYPHHKLHKRMLQLESLEKVTSWSTTIASGYGLENLPFKSLQDLQSKDISVASINEMQINSLNQIHQNQIVLQQRMNNQEHFCETFHTEMMKSNENYESINQKLDLILQSSSSNRTSNTIVANNNSNLYLQTDLNQYMVQNTVDKDTTNTITALKVSSINPLLKVEKISSLFYQWFAQGDITNYKPNNADERSTQKKLSKMICYLKRFLPDNTILNAIPNNTNDINIIKQHTSQIVSLSTLAQERVLEFLMVNDKELLEKIGKDGEIKVKKSLQKGAVWNNFKRLESIELTKFPMPVGVKDYATPKGVLFMDDISNFK